MGMVVSCFQQITVMILQNFDGNACFSDIPEFHEIVMARHQVVLFVWVEINVCYCLSLSWASLETELLTYLTL